MADLINLYKAVSGYGFPFAMFLVIVGLERGWIILRREADLLRAQIKDLETRLDFAVSEKDEWKGVALSGEAFIKKRRPS